MFTEKTTYKYADGHVIDWTLNNIIIKKANDSHIFNEEKKCVFEYDTGESVSEYSGLATDNNPNRSWAKAVYNPSAYSQLHYHSNRAEDYFILKGFAKVLIDNKKYFLKAGDHVHISPNQQHQVINASEKEELILIVKCIPSWDKNDYHIIKKPFQAGLKELNNK